MGMAPHLVHERIFALSISLAVGEVRFVARVVVVQLAEDYEADKTDYFPCFAINP